MKILNNLACRIIQSASIVGIALGLRHTDDQPIGEGAMPATVIQDSAFGSKRNAAPFTVGILLPIVRILERVRVPLILGEFASQRRWATDRPAQSCLSSFSPPQPPTSTIYHF